MRSTLSVQQMHQEAIGPITERLKYLKEQTDIDKGSGYRIVYDPSFNFVASDGNPLSVKFFHSTDPEIAAEVGAVSEQKYYTVLTKMGHLTNYPCLTTGRGDLIFVHDAALVGADMIFKGHQKLVDVDVQKCTQGDREVSNLIAEHVPRPMNAFIIYRNAQMANVRRQNPGIGNNDVSRIIGRKWRALDSESRAHYKGLAAKSAREHQVKHPGYKYTPRKPDDVVRRRKRYSATETPSRDPDIHKSISSINAPTVSLHQLIPGFPDLDSLTSTWVDEPTAAHFDALMSGFDCALGLATENSS